MIKIGCTKPMIRYETYKTYKKVDGSKGYEAKFAWNETSSEALQNYKKMQRSGLYRKIDIVPCGHCVGCRLDYARDKAVQLMCERINPKYKDNECWFLTLTYEDSNLKTRTKVNVETGEWFEGVSVCKEDMQKFWKRIRKHYPSANIKYLNCMEYGKQTYRPHAHAIVFGLPLDETQFIKIGINSLGDVTWTTPELDKIWGLGHVNIGEVTFRSCSYVARYTLKKSKNQYDDWWYESQGKDKEWVSMSDSIGKWLYDEKKEEIYDMDCVPVKDNNGNLCKPPRSFDRFYKRDNPSKWKEVKAKRQQAAETAIRIQEQQTDLKGREYLRVKEQKYDQFKDLRKDGKYEL